MPSDQDPIAEKVDHVLSQGQTRKHHCHYPGCTKQVPPAMFMCRLHWKSLPRFLQSRIWNAYRPGQEKDMRPSRTYLDTVDAVMEWIAANHGVAKRGCGDG